MGDASSAGLADKIEAWLSTVEIGGEEERCFDAAQLTSFAVENSFADLKPEEIYKAFVDLASTAKNIEAAERSKNEATLAAGTRLEITSKEEAGVKGRSFVLDEQLFVVATTEGGAASELGVDKGMRLVGFQGEIVQRNIKWSRLRSYAATQAFPHVFTFDATAAEAGAKAVAVYEEGIAAEAVARQALEEAKQKQLEEIVGALEVLTADNEDEAPARERVAIANYGKTAPLASAELMAGWLCQRLVGSVSPAISLKTLALISSLAETGSSAMAGCLAQRCMSAVNEAASGFSCPPHPTHGDNPQQLVRSRASTCLELLQAGSTVRAGGAALTSLGRKSGGGSGGGGGLLKSVTPRGRARVAAAKAEAAHHALRAADAVRVEVSREQAAAAGFRCDESLIVEEVPAGGLACNAGVEVGMLLIGFGDSHVQQLPALQSAYQQWTKLKQIAVATDFPHLYTFAPNLVASTFANAGQGAAGAQKASALPAIVSERTQLAETLELVVSEQAAVDGSYGTDFTLDEALWVVAVAPGGIAGVAGVKPGMKVVGFQRRTLGAMATLAGLKQATRGERAFPHYISFDPATDGESAAAGAAAVEAHNAAKRAASAKAEEIARAVDLLTEDDATPAPDR